MKRAIPKKFQGLFWSVDICHLDLEKDKNYIINQTLAYGIVDELRWLFQTYPRETIKQAFLDHKAKSYRRARFYFIKNMVLNIKQKLNESYYDRDLPRIIPKR